MLKERWHRAILVFMGVVCAAASPALAADDAALEKVSFLQILIHGAQWPGVFIVLMSLASVTIIIEHFWTIRRSTMFPESELETTRRLIEERKLKECVEYVRNGKSMFADVLTAGLRHGRHGFDAMQAAAEERAGAWGSRLFRRVEYLNIIGNLSPLLGLLGTVLGMIEAFGAMQEAHGAYKPENLAGGISLALVNTFLGLLVAIVSLGFFGLCRNRVDAMTVAAHAAVLDLLEYFRPGAAVTHSSSAASNANTKAEAEPRKPPQPADAPK
ncbi:MAG TPA: MotA/TolQ/ExbB proton channel family protein [Phycisphaerae bacterium]|nr:MotA/TolQ/ExbB proton channel family protein [Phycisphaerae bacterium]